MARKQGKGSGGNSGMILVGNTRSGTLDNWCWLVCSLRLGLVDTFVLSYTPWLNHYIPPAVRIPLGIVLLVVSGYLAIKGMSIVLDQGGRPRVKLGLFEDGPEMLMYGDIEDIIWQAP